MLIARALHGLVTGWREHRKSGDVLERQLSIKLAHLLSQGDAPRMLSGYFVEPSPGVTTYTGRLFEQFEDEAEDAQDRITAADLLAVEALSVAVPVEVTYELLHRSFGQELNGLIKAIPTDVRLGDPEARPHVAAESPAAQAWRLLKSRHKVGWVTAGKLMARKRPHLLPVYDSVVACSLGWPRQFWLSMHDCLSGEGLQARLDALREEVALPPSVSDLRLIDVVVWMSHRDAHRRNRCAEAVSPN